MEVISLATNGLNTLDVLLKSACAHDETLCILVKDPDATEEIVRDCIVEFVNDMCNIASIALSLALPPDSPQLRANVIAEVLKTAEEHSAKMSAASATLQAFDKMMKG